jgi:hypothetical protein
MTADDVIQMKILGQLTGIVGLNTVIRQIASATGQNASDNQIKAELLERLSEDNYIVEALRPAYADAFLREYKRYLGLPFEKPTESGQIELQVLGPGCLSCEKLTQNVVTLAAELQLAVDVAHVRDPLEIAAFGVMGTPALVVNGKVKSVGKVPPVPTLKKWVLEAADQMRAKRA